MERGLIVISVDGERIRYKMLPETWEIDLADGGRTFEASGQVQKNNTRNGSTYHLTATLESTGRGEGLWSLEGTLAGGELDYGLRYVILSHPKAPFVESEIP